MISQGARFKSQDILGMKIVGLRAEFWEKPLWQSEVEVSQK